jgi:hypothetical protein
MDPSKCDPTREHITVAVTIKELDPTATLHMTVCESMRQDFGQKTRKV